MTHRPHLIVMLTHHDCTVRNAYEIFEQCKRSKADFWGFKEQPLPLPQMKTLYTYMKEYGKTTPTIFGWVLNRVTCIVILRIRMILFPGQKIVD